MRRSCSLAAALAALVLAASAAGAVRISAVSAGRYPTVDATVVTSQPGKRPPAVVLNEAPPAGGEPSKAGAPGPAIPPKNPPVAAGPDQAGKPGKPPAAAVLNEAPPGKGSRHRCINCPRGSGRSLSYRLRESTDAVITGPGPLQIRIAPRRLRLRPAF